VQYEEDVGPCGGVRLSVFRAYDQLTNEWGGKGVHKHLDGDGLVFATSEEARAYAEEHGYTRKWFREYDPTEKARKREFFWQYIAPKKGLTSPTNPV
jgi:hypothetical protein